VTRLTKVMSGYQFLLAMWLCQLHLAHFDALIWPPPGCLLFGRYPATVEAEPGDARRAARFGAKRRPGLDTGSPEL